MEKRDYLMDQIEQLGRVLGKILVQLLGLKSEGRVSDGNEIASQSLKSELDFDLDYIESIPTETFIKVLVEKNKFSNQHLDQLADILLLIADDLAIQTLKKGKSNNFYRKCLEIYKHLDDNDLTYSVERQAKIDRIIYALT